MHTKYTVVTLDTAGETMSERIIKRFWTVSYVDYLFIGIKSSFSFFFFFDNFIHVLWIKVKDLGKDFSDIECIKFKLKHTCLYIVSRFYLVRKKYEMIQRQQV